MADGHKPIKNSLLSGATGNNFFEDAALFVPVVPLVEPDSQEPATAEIDLNSDDSPSNRASVEKDFQQFTLNETVPPPDVGDHPPPVISLFSRAATTGVDFFSGMLANTSAPKVDNITAQPPPPQKMEPLAASAASVRDSEDEEEAPSVVTLFNAPSSRLNTLTPSTSHVDFLSHPTNKSANEFEMGTTASLFSSNASPFDLPPTNLGRRVSPSFQPVSSMAPVPAKTLATSTFNFPMGVPETRLTPLPTAKPSLTCIPTPAVTNPMVPSAAVVSPLVAPPAVPSPLVPTPGVASPFVPFIASNPQNVTVGVPSPTIATPPIYGSPNSFRLGGQRMKYVACPEMQSAPAAALPPQNLPFNPTVVSGSSHPSTFTPIPTTQPLPQMQMGANISNISFSQQGVTSVSGGEFSPLAMSKNAHQYTQYANANPNPRPPLNANSYYNTPSTHHLGPQELPPLTYHWFYRKDVDGKIVWKPFSIIDSVALEDAFTNDPERLVPTDGGRYDVCVQKRLKTPVYWEEAPIEVRRGSWFYKGPMDNRYIPYDEDFAAKLEREYADCMRTGTWQKRLEFLDGESVIMHNAGVVVHFCQAAAPDDWGNLPESQIRPRVVKRGVEEIEVEDGESPQIDHLVFVVHGIGPICDFKLRNIVEAVDDFRGLSIQLIHSHFRESIEKGNVGRIEFLPVSWHKALHGDKGIDEQLKRITLRSIPKFRDFTNDTLLDILFYTSPVYCQTIIDSVGSELNRIYELFKSRNPSFNGKVSLTGHSLGSLILFDLLAHQALPGSANGNAENTLDSEKVVDLTAQNPKTETCTEVDLAASSSSRTVSYTVGTAGTGQPFITYPTIDFSPTAFFALGSPISMFVTVRGIEKLGNDFRLPTCSAFFNIFHPYDPVAYRIETLIDPEFQNRPVLIPHHKGRKRIHLELKETMARVGADIKHKVIDAVKNTINTVYHYTGFRQTDEKLDKEIQSAIVGEMEKKSEADGAEDENAHIRIGSLNGGRRIDHVLQEAPYETFNEYVFAMSTHVGYWESEDTMLLILTEIYGTLGIQRDRHISGAQSITSPTAATIVPNASSYFSPPIMNQYDSTSSYEPSAPPMQVNAAMQPSPLLFSMNNTVQNPSMGIPTALPTEVPPAQSQPVPMIPPSNLAAGILLPPNPVQSSATSSASGYKPPVIGNRPVADPTYFPRGVDPTAPMLTQSQIAPPPKLGFVRKQ